MSRMFWRTPTDLPGTRVIGLFVAGVQGPGLEQLRVVAALHSAAVPAAWARAPGRQIRRRGERPVSQGEAGAGGDRRRAERVRRHPRDQGAPPVDPRDPGPVSYTHLTLPT